MKLAEKIRYLRVVEGALRGFEREMTQTEVVHAIRKELKAKISQPYLSQIESGARPHLTNSTRTLLARFFKVHPGYLVDDPEGFHSELVSEIGTMQDRLDLWLRQGAERFRRDPELSRALAKLAESPETRKGLLLAGAIVETPELVNRLFQVLRPDGGPSLAAGGKSRTVDMKAKSKQGKI